MAYNPSIHPVYPMQGYGWGGFLFPAVIEWETGYTLDRQPVSYSSLQPLSKSSNQYEYWKLKNSHNKNDEI